MPVYKMTSKIEYDCSSERDKNEMKKVIDAYGDSVTFNERSIVSDISVIVYKSGLLGESKAHKLRGSINAEDVESAIVANDNSLETRLETEESAEYCTHCRADLRDYPNPTFCPECGRRPKPPSDS